VTAPTPVLLARPEAWDIHPGCGSWRIETETSYILCPPVDLHGGNHDDGRSRKMFRGSFSLSNDERLYLCHENGINPRLDLCVTGDVFPPCPELRQSTFASPALPCIKHKQKHHSRCLATASRIPCQATMKDLVQASCQVEKASGAVWRSVLLMKTVSSNSQLRLALQLLRLLNQELAQHAQGIAWSGHSTLAVAICYRTPPNLCTYCSFPTFFIPSSSAGVTCEFRN
jgi:hypothetical protein